MDFEHINPFTPNVIFLYPLSYEKTLLCCDFSGYKNLTFGSNGSMNSDLFVRLSACLPVTHFYQNRLISFSRYCA